MYIIYSLHLKLHTSFFGCVAYNYQTVLDEVCSVLGVCLCECVCTCVCVCVCVCLHPSTVKASSVCNNALGIRNGADQRSWAILISV